MTKLKEDVKGALLESDLQKGTRDGDGAVLAFLQERKRTKLTEGGSVAPNDGKVA